MPSAQILNIVHDAVVIRPENMASSVRHRQTIIGFKRVAMSICQPTDTKHHFYFDGSNYS